MWTIGLRYIFFAENYPVPGASLPLVLEDLVR